MRASTSEGMSVRTSVLRTDARRKCRTEFPAREARSSDVIRSLRDPDGGGAAVAVGELLDGLPVSETAAQGDLDLE